jgi:hypothetical protein
MTFTAREMTQQRRASRKANPERKAVGAAGESSLEPSSTAPTDRPHWLQLITMRESQPSEDDIKALIHQQILTDLSVDPIADEYNVIFLWDKRFIHRSNMDTIYQAVTTLDSRKPLLLIMDSAGGDIAAAYFIAKICREYSTDSFEVVVPRRAKSAATLICCGADKIHMGSLSELGPIDPQFEGVPALALKYSIEHLAELSRRYPAASGMFAEYLSRSLQIEALGYYERVAESATQYAERLLRSRRSIEQQDEQISEVAYTLVYAYKDHGFVIDANEAAGIFGTEIVSINTDHYELANTLHQRLDLLSWVVAELYGRNFSFIGTGASGCFIPVKPPK